MKCRAMQNSWLKAMLAAGIVLLAGVMIINVIQLQFTKSLGREEN